MSFRRDFHGGRTYGADPAEGASPGIGFNFALTIAWMKLKLSRLLKSPTSPSDLTDQHPDLSGTPAFPMADFARARAPAAKPERRGN
ncbi:MAG: hypothetical protein ACREB1_01805 [Sphingomicrobium sp.]